MKKDFVSILICAFSLAGCSSLSKVIEEPKVELSNVKVTAPSAEGATLVFALMVDNPNPIALEVDELVYDLEVAGKALTSGRLENGARVPAKEKAIVEVPVPVRYKELFASVMQLLASPTSPYRLKGSAKVGPFSIPFDKAGEVNLTKGI